MATKVAQETSSGDIEELLDQVDKTLDRLKTLYEQYFLGIQKQVPSYIHTDVERKLRDLQQIQIRNTGLRYRFATVQQKFASYNNYWRRTLRQIENGTYARNLSKIGREAVRTGAEIPEEILAAMPKRMRDQVVRDREQALAIAARRRTDAAVAAGDPVDLDLEEMPAEATEDLIALIKEPTELRKSLKTRDGAHVLDVTDSDLDFDAFFAQVEAQTMPERDDALATQKRAPVQVEPAKPIVDPNARRTGPFMPVDPNARRTGPFMPVDPNAPSEPADEHPTGVHQPVVRAPTPPPVRPSVPAPARPGVPMPARPGVPAPARPGVPMPASSQATKPNPIAPGAATAKGPVPVESMAGPFPRVTPPTPTPSGRPAIPAIPVPRSHTPSSPPLAIPKPGAGSPAISRPGTPSGAIPAIPRLSARTPTAGMPVIKPVGAPAAPTPTPAIVTQTRPTPRPQQAQRPATQPKPVAPIQPKPAQAAPQRPPPGMTDADVNALYAKYVKAKEMVGEKIGPGEHNKLLKTINAQAPKIMQQYNAKAVDFSVVVKDNQVIIRAKPKT